VSPHFLEGFLALDPIVCEVLELGVFYLPKEKWEGNEREFAIYEEVGINASQKGSLFIHIYHIYSSRT